MTSKFAVALAVIDTVLPCWLLTVIVLVDPGGAFPKFRFLGETLNGAASAGEAASRVTTIRSALCFRNRGITRY